MPSHDPTASPFDQLMGTEFEEVGPDRVVATLAVVPKLHQPAGILHGGVHCSLIEHIASTGAYLWARQHIDPHARVVGIANRTDFLRAVSDGVLRATGEPLQRGRTLQLWSVTVATEDGRPAAEGSVRLMNMLG